MNSYLHELKSYRTSAVIWTLALSGVAVMFLGLLEPFLKDVAASQKIIEQLPAAVRAALNIQSATFFTVNGFYAYVLTYILLIGAVQAMNLGVGIVSKETTARTVDFLLTRPVTRLQIYRSKVLAALTILVVTNIVFVAVATFAANSFTTIGFDNATFVKLSIVLFFVQLIFLALGLFVSMLFKRIRSVVAVSLPVVFAFFIVALLDSLFGQQAIRFMTPFRYFDTSYIIANGHYEWQYLAIELVVIVTAIAGGYALFARKDVGSA